MRTFLVATLLIGSFASAAVADDPFLRGRTWTKISADMKLAYVAGLSDMAIWIGTVANDPKLQRMYTCECPRDEIVSGLDLIYADPANANVPVVLAYRAFLMRVAGFSDAEVQKLLAAGRRFDSAVRDATPPGR